MITIFLVTLTAAVAAVAAAIVFAPRVEIVTHATIDATPGEVWALLANPESHKDWNPFLVRMEGEMIKGARLTNTMRPGGGNREMTFRPVILTISPGRELRWLGRFLLPRIFDGEHYFLLEERDGQTRFTQGEKFRGIALWLVNVEQFRPDFEAMNAALKSRVESRA